MKKMIILKYVNSELNKLISMIIFMFIRFTSKQVYLTDYGFYI